MKVRRKPEVFEAVAVNAFINTPLSNWEAWSALPEWVRDLTEAGTLCNRGTCVDVRIGDAPKQMWRSAQPDDYLLRDPSTKALYVCPGDVFESMFDVIEA